MNAQLLNAVLTFSLAAMPPPPPGAPTEQDAVRAVVKGNTDFALDLHQQLRQQPGNLCYSPWSISTVLAMTSAGAQGRTLEQMTATLHLPNAQLTHAGAGALLRQMKVQHGYELDAANAMFVRKDIPWRKDFLDLTRRHYGSAIFTVNFAQQPESARQSINSWVAGQTRKRIPDLLGAGTIDSRTAAVLVNALYFKGQWDKPFKKNRTEPMVFARTPDDKIKTPTMAQSDRFLYREDQMAQVLGMAYKGNDLMMVFVLPRERNGLAALEKTLTAKQVQDWIGTLQAFPRVDVYLPRFKMTCEFDLKRTLAAMGMPDLFEDYGDFRGMANYPLKVSAVIHKAYLDLQEEGTEAAAATAVTPTFYLSAPPAFTPPPPPVFRADHPFLFSIIDRRSGSLLFVGRVSDPTK